MLKIARTSLLRGGRGKFGKKQNKGKQSVAGGRRRQKDTKAS